MHYSSVNPAYDISYQLSSSFGSDTDRIASHRTFPTDLTSRSGPPQATVT